MKKRWFLCGTGVLFAADQILKSYSENSLEKGQEKKLTEHIVLRRVSNEGMCLGVLSPRPKIVKVFSVAATGGRDSVADVGPFQNKRDMEEERDFPAGSRRVEQYV